MEKLSEEYWNEQYKDQKTGWDVGYPSPAIIKFCLNAIPYDIKILIPGCGNAYEGQELYENGFKNITLLDISQNAIDSAKKKHPELPDRFFVKDDFFQHEEKYELILEQTFFCAIDPKRREEYINKIYNLLVPNGLFVGILFDKDFEDGPPYGGSKEEYEKLIESKFKLIKMEKNFDSIPQRTDSEVFFIARKVD